MKALRDTLLVYSILISVFSYSQNDNINKIDENGRRIGYWKFYNEKGKIKEEGRYGLLTESISAEDLFFYGITKKDPIIQSVKTGDWKNFNYDGKLISITRFDKRNYFEPKLLLHTYPLNYKIYGRIGESQIIFLKLESLIKKKVTISYEANSDRIKFLKKFISIKPKSKLEIPFTIRFDQGESSDSIVLYYHYQDTIRTIIDIEHIGFHLSTDDFVKSNQNLKSITITGDLIYLFRSMEESELKVYPFYKGNDLEKFRNYEVKETAIIPLSLEFNNLNISHLPRGYYLFRLVNYRDEIDLFVIIERK